MSRKTRRILFVLAVLAFMVLGFVVIAYAQGYRWDFKAKRLLLSGAIYLETITPEDAQITINAKSAHKTTAALIKNLLPLRRYKALVAKEGYLPWEKEFEIAPGLVAGAETIVLFPEKLNAQTIWPDPAITEFSVSPDQKYIAAKTGPSRLIIRDLSRPDATTAPINFTDKRKTIAVGFLKNNRGWSAESKKLIFYRDISARRLWYIWDDAKGLADLTSLYERQIVIKQASVSPLPAKFTASKIVWFGGGNNLLALINNNLFNLDLSNGTVTDLKLNEVIDFDSYENKIAILKKPDILLFIDSAVDNISVLGQAKFAPQKILFSPQGDKIAYANSTSLGVFWLKETSRQPLKKANDQEVVYNSNGQILETFWHRYGEHLLFLENQKLKTAELDARPPLNTATWNETISDISYLSADSKLFILESGAVKSVEGEF
ncbi:MAG: hypothetical protein HYV54_01905 [Parcubacteria group bacterium]|nr:hypothetical protein [Parcubacteria group bacterium]